MTPLRFCAMLLLTGSVALPARAQLDSVWIAGDGANTRITIFAANELSAQPFLMRNDDARSIKVRVDAFSVTEAPTFGEPMGGIRAYEVQSQGLMFELDQPMMVARELSLPPTATEAQHRYIVDLVGVSEARFDRTARGDMKLYASQDVAVASVPVMEVPADRPSETILPPTPILKPVRNESRSWLTAIRTNGEYVVVIDPGHGGRDPGALASNGTQEADIVLLLAKDIERELLAAGRYKVYLTRTSDVYVEHEDRVSKARDWGADLFISIHADAAMRPHTSGASVYTISTTGERRKDQTANKYGWHLPIEEGTPDEVSGIIEDLIKRETKSNSKTFAEILVPEMEKAGPLLRNTHRRKNLFVLLAPDVPAVLIEAGFMTNRDDAKRLKSKSGRQQMAQAVRRGIDTYFDRQEARLADN
jgi:N-acetylmuramoyl-L-alanine amidase